MVFQCNIYPKQPFLRQSLVNSVIEINFPGLKVTFDKEVRLDI